MNIVHIIGNGFDLNLGLKTDYKSFCTYYHQKSARSSRVESLKKSISDGIVNWSDLELALGEYTRNINTTEEFDEIFEDILDELAGYLSKEEDIVNLIKTPNKFHDDLWNPQEYLPTYDRVSITGFKEKLLGYNNFIDIITLNYTQTIEKLLNNPKDKQNIFTLGNGYVYLRPAEHLHGYLDNRMILGVNDISQISNSSFHTNEDVLNILVKPFCNKVSKETTDDKCIKLIREARLICIFGCSLGDTDKFWWELIGEWLKSDNRLIIFEKSGNVNPRMLYKNSRNEKRVKEVFLKKTKLSEEEKKTVTDKIYVAANTNMFSELFK